MPPKSPWTVAGRLSVAWTCAIRADAVQNETPGGVFNEIVVDGSASVWLTCALVDRVDQCEIDESGIVLASAVLIAALAGAA